MVREYDLDALRLDTAPYMPMGFLAELQVVLPLPSCYTPARPRLPPTRAPARVRCMAASGGVTPPSQCLSPLRSSASAPPFQCLYQCLYPLLPLPPRACAGHLGADVTLLSY